MAAHLRRDADLDLTDVLFLQQQHGQTGGRCRRRWFAASVRQQILMPVVLQAILVPGDGELAAQGLGVHPDPMEEISKLSSSTGFPHQDVTVQTASPSSLAAPVVVVRGSTSWRSPWERGHRYR